MAVNWEDDAEVESDPEKLDDVSIWFSDAQGIDLKD